MSMPVKNPLNISKITLGTVQLGMNYGINNADGKPGEEQSLAVLRTAAECGINAFDTSSDYGDSERIIGKFLGTCPAPIPTVITKFSVGNAFNVAEAEKNVRNEVESSLKRLGLAKLPVLLYHSEPEFMRWGDTLKPFMESLKAEGIVGRVGVSILSKETIRRILKDGLYEAVQAPMNIWDTALIREGYIDRLKKAGTLVFIRSVFLQGLFFCDPETLPGGVLQKAAAPLRELRKLAETENISIARLAFGFIRDTDGVDSLVVGAEKPEQVRSNAEFLTAPALPGRLREKILEKFSDVDGEVTKPWLWNR